MTNPPVNGHPEPGQPDDDTAVFPVYSEAAFPLPPQATPPPAARKKTPWVVGAAASALVLLCCCGATVGSFVTDSGRPQKPTAAASATTDKDPLVEVRPAPTTPAAVEATGAVTPSARPTTTVPRPSPSRTTSSPRPTRTSSKPTPPPEPKTDPRFRNCKEANKAGYGPYYRGVDPEYAWYRDQDGDGVVCER